MNKLFVKLENCYGINLLEHEFDFTKGSNIVIYAPNGTMKTSFSKTFLQLSKNKLPEEKMHNKRPVFDIKVDDNQIVGDEIFVIESMSHKRFQSDKLTTLLVDIDSMTEYNELNTEIINKKKALIINLNRYSGIKKDILEKNLLDDLAQVDLFDCLQCIDLDSGIDAFSKFKYNDIFNDKVVELIRNEDVSENIKEYYDKYNELIDKSPYFKKGIFNIIKAENVIKSTKVENFFDAEHKIYLNGYGDVIESAEEFESIIIGEKEKIFTNDKLKEIEKKINEGVKAVKEFQDLLETYPELIPYLTKDNYDQLRNILWKSYLKLLKIDIVDMLLIYNTNKARIKEIEDSANIQRTLWEDVVQEFQSRFYTSYEIYIENKKSMVLGNPTPVIKLKFTDNDTGTHKDHTESSLEQIETLSQGEKRVLYLLNIIFEVKARQKGRLKTLFIVDDIVDSFDYKNKYAIIEYLKDISDEGIFNQIILTHNFDFFRTVQGRILQNSKWHNSFMAQKEATCIRLLDAGKKKTTNPFDIWKQNFATDNIILVAIIPFIRNLAEYTGHVDTKNKLTKLLHIKDGTKIITIKDLEDLIKNILHDKQNISLPNPNKKVFDLIYEQADVIVIPAAIEEVELEKKVVLSIAIRLKAEEFMIIKIADSAFVNLIKEDQTSTLFNKVKRDILVDQDTLGILELVNLITPENIHLNSFMYEPILDMSNSHLRDLYSKVTKLLEGSA
ncbi:MAG: hypothetical protein WA099_08010 [Sulfuricurvum sp.]